MQMQLEKQASYFIWISLFELLRSLSLLKVIRYLLKAIQEYFFQELCFELAFINFTQFQDRQTKRPKPKQLMLLVIWLT